MTGVQTCALPIYEQYLDAAEQMLEMTESGFAPWTIIEATSKWWARKKVFEAAISALENALGDKAPPVLVEPKPKRAAVKQAAEPVKAKPEKVKKVKQKREKPNKAKPKQEKDKKSKADKPKPGAEKAAKAKKVEVKAKGGKAVEKSAPKPETIPGKKGGKTNA